MLRIPALPHASAARNASWLLLAVMIACKPKALPEPPPEPKPIHPDLICPVDTVGTGTPPPGGTEVWCQKTLVTGRTVRHGPTITWHPNETRASMGDYAEGVIHGPWVTWYPTGVQESQGSFVRGIKNGLWTEFHLNGARKSEGEYVEGKENGPWIFWAEDLTRTEGQFVLGQRDGVWTDYSPEGVPVRERVYRTGRLVSQREL